MALLKNTFANFLMLFAAFALISCKTTTPSPQPPTVKIKPKIALALGGGAARGFAHIGVIKILSSHGINPDYIVGTSAGAIVGSLYASGYNAYALQQIATELDEKVFADWGLPNLGLLKGDALADFINQNVQNRPIERMKIPFAAVATNLQTGETAVFKSGNTGEAVRASASVPGVFRPTIINNISYVDGGLVSPVPVRTAKEMGADIIIAVDISTKARFQPIDSITNILWQTISIMGEQISKNELQDADFIIRPQLPYIKSWDFTARNTSITEGEKAAINLLPQIQKKLAEYK